MSKANDDGPRVIPFSEELVKGGFKPGWGGYSPHVLLRNDRLGYQVLRVVVVKDGKPNYDTVLRTLRGSGYGVPVRQSRRGLEIGLIRQWRLVTRQEEEAWKASYPDVDVSKLGRWGYELPRGFANDGETNIEAAVRECHEEGGAPVVTVHWTRSMCEVSTIHPQFTGVAIVEVSVPDEAPLSHDEGVEISSKGFEWFTLPEIWELVNKGEFYELACLGAIALLLLKIQVEGI